MKSLQIQQENKLDWDSNAKLPLVKQLFAPDVTDLEFLFFVDLARSSGLNPFKREIWATKIDRNKSAQIFIGINGYRAIAHRHKDYEMHQVDAVYENDQFQVINNEVNHTYQLTNRGALKGAYCMVKRKNATKPMFVFVDFDEYNKNFALWKNATQGGKPATMIKKIAESQALRQAFSEQLNGTYTPEEMTPSTDNSTVTHIHKIAANTEKLKNIINVDIDKNTGEIIESNASIKQVNIIKKLLVEKKLSTERINSALKYYKVTDFNQLSAKKAFLFIQQLERISND